MNAKQQLSEIDRQDSSRSIGPFAGLPPRVHGTISDTDRRIYAEKLRPGAQLVLELDKWEIEDPADHVRVFISKQMPVQWVEVFEFDAGPIPDRPSVFIVEISADRFVEDNPPATPTTWLIRYRAGAPGQNQWTSDQTTVIIDRRAPYQAAPNGPKSRPPLATLPTLSTGDTIDDAFVDRNKTGMTVNFAHTYANPQPDDVVRFYISQVYSATNPEAPLYEGPASDEITVDIDLVAALESKALYAYYVLIDAVGNISTTSVAKGINVRFTPLPVLGTPIVPLAVTDQLIDLKDCQQGVTIQINRVTNVLDDDEVWCYWNGTEIGVAVKFGTSNQVVVSVPFNTIFNDYYKDGADTKDDVLVTVRATLLRGVRLISESSIDIASNIYYPGPVNPLDPVPPNLELKNFPHITSTTVDDILEPVDYGKDHEVTIELWVDADKPVKSGQQIYGEYAGKRFGPTFLSDGDTTATLTLPRLLIEDGGLGPNKPLQYFVSDIGGQNENTSQITQVTNNAIVVDLVPPIVESESEGTLFCHDLTAADFGLNVGIPGNPTHLIPGRDVILYAQGYRDELMTELADDTDFASAPHTIVGSEGSNGFDMVIEPYDPKIRNIPVPPPVPIVPGDYRGWWKIWYAVDIGGKEFPSETFEISIKLVNGRGEYCEDQ